MSYFSDLGSLRRCFLVLFVVIAPLGVTVSVSFAEEGSGVKGVKGVKPPKHAIDVLGIFRNRAESIDVSDVRTVVDVSDPLDIFGTLARAKKARVEVSSAKTDEQEKGESVEAPQKKKKHVFVSDDPLSHLLPPDEDFPVRINPEAPGPFIGMATALDDGDRETAAKYAGAYVRYMRKLMFRVSEITDLIGEAMVREGVLDEEDWVGVGQFINRQFAAAREKNGTAWKMTHESAMERIVPDPNGKAEIYFFFTLNCKWCRDMAPDVERLWRVVQADANLKMVSLTPQRYPTAWMESFKDFAGMTGPVYYGAKVAKALRVGFVPALVVVSPGNKTSYLKTGKQSFEHMYEFVRTVQGLPGELSDELKRAIDNNPIGQIEIAHSRGKRLPWEDSAKFGESKQWNITPGLMRVNSKAAVKETIERF